jgi:hypothetical protein
MRELHGSCHCGNIAYVLNWPLGGDIPVRRCACSFCRKQGAIYAAHRDAALAVTVAGGQGLSRYRFASKTADFCFCSKCGVFVLVTSKIDERLSAVVNVNTLHGFPLPAEVETRNFQGETVEDRMARRRNTWIADVAITIGQPWPTEVGSGQAKR